MTDTLISILFSGTAFATVLYLISVGLSIFALVSLPLVPLGGMLVDRFGPRRVGIPGLLLSATCFAAFGLMSGTYLQWVLIWVAYTLASVLMAGPKALGVIEGIAEAVSSVIKLLAGVLADRTGKTRAWVTAGYGIAGFARPLIGITQSWLGVLACRFADRVGKGLRSAPRDALINLSIEPNQRGLAFGFHRAMDNFGAVVGPLVAGALLAAGVGLCLPRREVHHPGGGLSGGMTVVPTQRDADHH